MVGEWLGHSGKDGTLRGVAGRLMPLPSCASEAACKLGVSDLEWAKVPTRSLTSIGLQQHASSCAPDPAGELGVEGVLPPAQG